MAIKYYVILFYKNASIKGKLLVPDLITCYSRNAQRDWIEYFSLVEVEIM